ncbi:MAG: hypothetical protein BMS9Abin07_1725 [Acidimicrobiia bacterium]|nr:MAG: hypothetical protein BMS9Abin07_1725 [Acidimicrobiia bacterium]
MDKGELPMTAPDPDTRALYTRLQELLGSEHAETLMTHLPAEPGTEMATKSDIAVLDARFDRLEEFLVARFDRVDHRFEQVDQRLEHVDLRLEHVDLRLEHVDQRMAGMETRMDRLDGRFGTIDDRMYGLHDVIRDQLKTYTITMVGGMTALTAIFATLLTIVT